MRSPVNFQEAAPDSVLSFEVLGHIFIRGQAKNYEVTKEHVVSVWSPLPGIRVQSEICPAREGHKRIHVIESEYECIAYDAGFALPLGEEEGCEVRCLLGGGEPMLVKPDPNTNLIHSKTVIPVVRYEIKKGINKIETEVLY